MTLTYFPWSPEVALLLHPPGAFARPPTAALFGSYYFSILKVGISVAGTALPSTLAAMPLRGAALPLTPGIVQSIVVPLSAQATPSVSGSSSMPLISMLPVTVTQAAGLPMLLSNMPHAAMQPAAMQPTAMPLTAVHLLLCWLGLIRWVVLLVLLQL